MPKTYKDFKSRQEFIKNLDLWHFDLHSKSKEFLTVDGFLGFESETMWIKKNLDTIKDTWNNQSISQIETIVTNSSVRDLEIMQGQKHDKQRAGYSDNQPMYRVKQCPTDSVFYRIANTIGLTNAQARYHVQFPGEVTVFHTDIYSPAHEFLPEICHDRSDEEVGKDLGIRRVLIALEDWQWGQIMMFGADVWKQWTTGQMIIWDYGVPHCAANMGYEPRLSVSITGMMSERFTEFCRDAR